jgi:hypothetical protein
MNEIEATFESNQIIKHILELTGYSICFFPQRTGYSLLIHWIRQVSMARESFLVSDEQRDLTLNKNSKLLANNL